jgi:hypothetical protein
MWNLKRNVLILRYHLFFQNPENDHFFRSSPAFLRRIEAIPFVKGSHFFNAMAESENVQQPRKRNF